jgi:glutamate/tyrosine decarboxylase-like PLP-dependent enzyme
MENKMKQAEVLQDVFGLINDWMKNADLPETKVLEQHSPQELSKLLALNLGSSSGMDGVMGEVKNYLKYAVKTNHPGYVNQLFGGFNFPAFIGEVITSLTNTSMYTYEVAPVATLMERKVVNKMLSFTGWKTGTGSMMTGGSNTNMVAMVLARHRMFPEAKENGMSGLPLLAIFVSDRSHFSMLKGANTIGLGQKAIFKVPVDAQGRMRGEALSRKIEEAREKGFTPMMVCATSGTTETGSFDDLEEIAPLAKKHKMWFHVDGSWGGSVILSEKRRHFFEGLEKADSFSWNPHKLMSIPLVCSVLLVKDEGISHEAISTGDAGYIYHDHEQDAYDFGPSSLQCGRRVDVLKLWLSWKFHGDEGYAQRIEHVFDLAQYASSVVEKHEQLELCFETQSLNVNFRFKVPSEEIDIDEFNESIRYKLIEEGKVMVNYCRLEKGLSIRLVLLNPDLTKEDLDRFFQHFVSVGNEILKNTKQKIVS